MLTVLLFAFSLLLFLTLIILDDFRLLKNSFISVAAVGIIMLITSITLFLTGIARLAAYSPTANRMWKEDHDCLIIKDTLCDIRDNIGDYEVENNFIDAVVLKGELILIHKETGVKHILSVDNSAACSYFMWVKDGHIVIRNGYIVHDKDKGGSFNDFSEEFYPLANDWYISEAINDKIFDLIKEIIHAKKEFDKKENAKLAHKNIDLLNDKEKTASEEPTTKTLQIVAPIDAIITVEASRDFSAEINQ